MYDLRVLNDIILDSGRTRHMFVHKYYFANLRTVAGIVIRVGDGREVPTMGVNDEGFL